MLQRLFGKVLRFIDDEGHEFARNCPFDQIAIELVDKEETVIIRHGQPPAPTSYFSAAL